MWCKHLNKEININKDFESECSKCLSEHIKRKYNVDDDEFELEDEDYTIKDQFLFDFENSKKEMMIIILNRSDALSSREIVINSTELDSKMNYYKEHFDDYLNEIKNEKVFIENYIFI
jgi:hypothetical protein